MAPIFSDDAESGNEDDDEEEEDDDEEEENENDSSAADNTLDTSKEESSVDMSKLTKSQKKRLKKKLAQQTKDKPQMNGVDKAKVRKEIMYCPAKYVPKSTHTSEYS